MEIEKIIYNTTREIFNVEDKLRIASIFLFCNRLDSETFAELLYTDDPEEFISEINNQYSEYNIDLKVNFKDKNVKNSFYKTRFELIKKEDENGYYKALHEQDEFALVINEIVNYKFDELSLIKQVRNINKQLKLF
jgi:hypothetical protein